MSEPCPDGGGPTIQVGTWSPPRFGPFCEVCHRPPESAVVPAGFRDAVNEFVTSQFADYRNQPLLPKPFDLADLTRLVSEVSMSMKRPTVDRAVIAPDVKDWLLTNVATKPAERSGPDHLWGIPVVIDEGMEPGAWELRDGDRVVRSHRAGGVVFDG